MKGGAFGVFSYGMNLDLKLQSSIRNGVQGNSYEYPMMPPMSGPKQPQGGPVGPPPPPGGSVPPPPGG